MDDWSVVHVIRRPTRASSFIEIGDVECVPQKLHTVGKGETTLYIFGLWRLQRITAGTILTVHLTHSPDGTPLTDNQGRLVRPACYPKAYACVQFHRNRLR